MTYFEVAMRSFSKNSNVLAAIGLLAAMCVTTTLTSSAPANAAPGSVFTIHTKNDGTWAHVAPSTDPASVVSTGINSGDPLEDICYLYADGHFWDLIRDPNGRDGSLWHNTAGWISEDDLDTMTWGYQRIPCSSSSAYYWDNRVQSKNGYVHVAPSTNPTSVVSTGVSENDELTYYCYLYADGHYWDLVRDPNGRDGSLWYNTVGWISEDDIWSPAHNMEC